MRALTYINIRYMNSDYLLHGQFRRKCLYIASMYVVHTIVFMYLPTSTYLECRNSAFPKVRQNEFHFYDFKITLINST